jgi:hypothetical protein
MPDGHARVLIAARAEVEGLDQVRGHGETPDGVCALGGLSRLRRRAASVLPVRAAIQGPPSHALPGHHEVVSAFNDDHRTTKADVLALYDRAIMIAEAVKVTADTAHTFATVS